MDTFMESSPVTFCYPMFTMLNIDVTEKSKVPVMEGFTVRAKLGIIMLIPRVTSGSTAVYVPSKTRQRP